LINFPRTLNQAKIFEKAFTGYQSITDKSKLSTTESFEVWSKFTDPEKTYNDTFTGEIIAQPSIFDKVIVLDPSLEEL
jgi:adenylate kinase family enzyme